MNYSDSVPGNIPFDVDDQAAPSTVKFGLFIKTREMDQLEQSLKHILLLPKAERDAWVLDHEEMMNDLIDSYMRNSALALDGLQLDSEATALSIEFVTKLRDVMNTLRGILDDAQNLTS